MEERSASHEALVRRYIDALNAPTWEALQQAALPLLAEDIDFQEPSAKGTHQGIAPFLQILKINKQAFPDMLWIIEEAFCNESGVAIRWSAKGTHAGPYILAGSLTIPPTHKTIQLCGFAVLGVKSEQIATFRGYPDRYVLMTQLGILVLPN